MSDIHEALDKLFRSVERLEGMLEAVERKQAFVRQTDFLSTMPGVDPAIVAYKLDAAIAKVEQVLSEAA